MRQLWLRSRERQAAIKRDRYTCVDCGAKQSRAKGREVFIEVDHLNGIEWENMIDYVFRHLLVSPDDLETVCKTFGCHEKRTEERRSR